MFVVPILLGIGCAVALSVAAYSHDGEASILGAMLCVMLPCAVAAWYFSALWMLPVMDLYFGLTAGAILMLTGKEWVALLIPVVSIRLGLHVFQYFTGLAYFVPYAHGLNATFAILLALVATSGGNRGLGILFDCLGRGSRNRVPAKASSPFEKP